MKSQKLEFWLVLLLVLAPVVIVPSFYPYSPSAITLGTHDIYHWAGWTGALYIAAAIPIFSFLKKRYQKSYKTITRFHIFGNLIAFLLVSFHFTYQLGSPPILGTATHLGLAVYSGLVIQTFSGILLRYQPGKYVNTVKFIHVAFMTNFYLVFFIHILHGENII